VDKELVPMRAQADMEPVRVPGVMVVQARLAALAGAKPARAEQVVPVHQA
jgi:hypothetical protein